MGSEKQQVRKLKPYRHHHWPKREENDDSAMLDAKRKMPAEYVNPICRASPLRAHSGAPDVKVRVDDGVHLQHRPLDLVMHLVRDNILGWHVL